MLGVVDAGALAGATLGATLGTSVGTGVGEVVQAASAASREMDRAAAVIARFIRDLSAESAILFGQRHS
jgi:outer membrane lipoprotein SlyB